MTDFVLLRTDAFEGTLPKDEMVVDFAGSTLAGNIDPVQMQELPLNGRDWLGLTLLTPLSRVNAIVDDTPVSTSEAARPSDRTICAPPHGRHASGCSCTYWCVGTVAATRGKSSPSARWLGERFVSGATMPCSGADPRTSPQGRQAERGFRHTQTIAPPGSERTGSLRHPGSSGSHRSRASASDSRDSADRGAE